MRLINRNEHIYTANSIAGNSSRLIAATASIVVSIMMSGVVVHAEDAAALPTYTIRYRLTVSASMGEKKASASSVVELRIIMQPRMLDGPPWKVLINGEATFVDFGDGRNLVALLNAGPASSDGTDIGAILFRSFGLPVVPANAAAIVKLHGERSVDPASWPAFVTFEDAADPLSVKRVNPTSSRNSSAPGVHIESVTIAITEDPVTRGLERLLPWLTNIPQQISDPKRIAMNKLRLGLKAFIQRSP